MSIRAAHVEVSSILSRMGKRATLEAAIEQLDQFILGDGSSAELIASNAQVAIQGQLLLVYFD
jgi:hypothetical protein